jgi:transcription antitermination factor NusG
MDRWFVVRAEGRRVMAVADALGGYAPTMERLTKPARKKQAVVSRVPIFPGWVFVPYTEAAYHECRTLQGVRGVMRYGKRGVLLLGPDDMERVQWIEKQQRVVLTDSQSPVWAIGDSVEVQGLLAGMQGIIVGIKGQNATVDVGANFPVTVHCCLLATLGVS